MKTQKETGEEMRKKIRFFHQHSMETCGPSCALMILDLYRKVQYPTVKQEQKLYKIYKSKAFCGMSGAALAACLAWNNLDITLIHSCETMIHNDENYFTEELFQAFYKEYAEQISSSKDNFKVENGREITCETLKELLEEKKQLILECIVPGNADGIHEETLHWIVVYGYKEECFLACDPLSGKITLTEQEIERYMNTPIGKILIVIEGTQAE